MILLFDPSWYFLHIIPLLGISEEIKRYVVLTTKIFPRGKIHPDALGILVTDDMPTSVLAYHRKESIVLKGV
jgi:hypothetical protein